MSSNTVSLPPSRALFLHLAGEIQRRPDGHIFKGDFVKDGVLFRCRGDSGLIDGGDDFAIQKDGHIEFWKNGKLSRDPAIGPAVVSLYGDYAEYWLDGTRIA